jgi:integral membrane sensor domain MASE1
MREINGRIDDRRQTILMALLFAAYLGCLAFYDLATRGENGMPAFWPCNAMLAAGLMHLSGWRRPALVAACAASCVLMHFLAGDPWSIVLIYTACDIAESCLIAWLIRRVFQRTPKVRSLRAAVLVVLIALPVAAAMATIGSTLSALVATGSFRPPWVWPSPCPPAW